MNKNKKVALITGVTGQDGAYLSEFLLNKNYIVHGLKRRTSSFNTHRIDHIYQEFDKRNNDFHLHHGDITDTSGILKLISKINPDEIYNLAAQSHVGTSFEIPEYTANVDALGVLRILETIRALKIENKVRFYQASTSELFGDTKISPQNENTAFHPRSPYGVAKLYGYWIVVNYREAFDIYACNGILFNHESPLRGETFVTRKITRGLVRIKLGIQDCLYLGNLDAKRDWGHARDYVEMQWLMLQQNKPEDFVIATGVQYSVREFVEIAANKLDLQVVWRGKGLNEKGFLKINDKLNTKKPIIQVDKRYFRPSEVNSLLGDASKAKKKFGWKPKITFEELVNEMIEADFKEAKDNLNNK